MDRDIHPMVKDLQLKTRFAEPCTSHDLKNYDIDRYLYARTDDGQSDPLSRYASQATQKVDDSEYKIHL